MNCSSIKIRNILFSYTLILFLSCGVQTFAQDSVSQDAESPAVTAEEVQAATPELIEESQVATPEVTATEEESQADVPKIRTEVAPVAEEAAPVEEIVKKVTYKPSVIKKYDKLCTTAEALIDKENYEKALGILDQAVTICPETYKAYALKSICLRSLNDLDGAKENAQKAFSLNPEDYLTNEEMGTLSSLDGRYHKGLFFLDKAEQLNKNYVRTYNSRGLTYYLLKEYDKSIADFNRALQIEPTSKFARESRIKAYLDSDKKKANLALSDVNTLIQQNPKNMDYYKLRARCYAYLNKVPMALADINKVVKNQPESFDSYMARLEVYNTINASSDLINKDLSLAEQYAGNNSKNLMVLALNAVKNENFKLADRFLTKVLALNPTMNEALVLKAGILIENCDYNQALSYLNKIDTPALETPAEVYYLNAVAKLGIGGWTDKKIINEGIQDLSKAMEKGYEKPNCYLIRGAAHVILGEYKLGIEDLTKFEQLNEAPTIASLHWLGFAHSMTSSKDAGKYYAGVLVFNNLSSVENLKEINDALMKTIFRNTSDRDLAAKVNLATIYSDLDYQTFRDIMTETRYSSAKLAKGIEKDGKIIVSPFANANCEYSAGLSQEMKEKLLSDISYKAIFAAGRDSQSLVEPLSIFFETTPKKQSLDKVLKIVEVINKSPYGHKNALLKINEELPLGEFSAKEDIEKVKKIRRNAYYNLGLIEQRDSGLEYAMKYYNSAIDFGYPQFNIYATYSNYYFHEKKDYFKTVTWATKALNIKNDAEQYALRGMAKAKLNDYDSAIYDFGKALGYNNKLNYVYYERANIYFDQKKWALAQADYIKYAATDTSEPSTPFNIATCLQNQGKTQAALPWYEKAKSLYQQAGNQTQYNECVRRINRIKGYSNWW